MEGSQPKNNLSEEEKRRAMLNFFATRAHVPEALLHIAPAIERISPSEHERIFNYLKSKGCVDGDVRSLLDGGTWITGKITSKGMEINRTNSPIEVPMTPSQTFNISSSSNFAIGNNNTQAFHQNTQYFIDQIDSSNASSEQKQEAKTLLRNFLSHPLVAAVAGGAVSLLG